MPHISTTTVIAAAFVLLAVAACLGLFVLLADLVSPLVQSASHGVSLRDRLEDVFARVRRRHDDDADDDESDDLDDATAALLAMIPGVPIVVDESDEVVRANPAAYRLGVVDDDVIVDERIGREVRRIREHGGRTSFELTTTTPSRFAAPAGTDGRDEVVRVDGGTALEVSRPNWLKVTVGRISERFVVVLIDDVSETVRFLQVRDDFIANVSEQLLKPSEDLRRLADALERGGRSQEQIAQDARNVRRTISYIEHMVKDLLLLIKAQEQVTPSETNRLDILAEVQAAADAVEPIAARRGQRVVVRGDEALVVHGESEQIRSAIGKLLENALAYSPQDATIGVDVRRGGTGSDAVIRVIDRGEGIAPQEQRRIFERFYRGGNQNRETAEGVGLGLAIVKHVALTHHGSVQVWSRPGQGSTFTLALPLASDRTPDAAQDGGDGDAGDDKTGAH